MDIVSRLRLDARKPRARAWFEELRDKICAAFEKLEDDLPARRAARRARPAGKFKRTPWERTDHTGESPAAAAS